MTATITAKDKVNFCKLNLGGDDGSEKPVIRMFGVTEAGNSVAAHVHNFTSYFYVHVIEPVSITNKDISDFQQTLN